MTMKTQNLCSPRSGAPVANQFSIFGGGLEIFQSYMSTVCKIDYNANEFTVYDAWNYSRTTTKYFKIFLESLDFDYYELKKLLNKYDESMTISDGSRDFKLLYAR